MKLNIHVFYMDIMDKMFFDLLMKVKVLTDWISNYEQFYNSNRKGVSA